MSAIVITMDSGKQYLAQPGAGQSVETRQEWLGRILKDKQLEQSVRELAMAELAD